MASFTVSNGRIVAPAGPQRTSGLYNLSRERTPLWKNFLDFSKIIIMAPTHAAQLEAVRTQALSAGRVHGSHQRAPSRAHTGCQVPELARPWLNFSGNSDATHTFPFFADRRDESHFSEVCSAPGLRPASCPDLEGSSCSPQSQGQGTRLAGEVGCAHIG